MIFKIHLNAPLIGLDGNPMGQETLSKIVANELAFSNKGKPAKMNDWAHTLFTDGFVEADDTDLNFIKDFVHTHERLVNLVKHQVSKAIEAQIREQSLAKDK